MEMDLRRRMMGSINKLVVFENGNDFLSNGYFYGGIWNGRPSFENGVIKTEVDYISASDSVDGTAYRYAGKGSIYGIDFSGYKKLCARVNIPYFYSAASSLFAFSIGIGYGPKGAAENQTAYLPSEWTGERFFGKTGDFDVEMDISEINGLCPINLYADGVYSEKAVGTLNVYDIWLE